LQTFLTFSFLPAFQITYPKKGDLVYVYDGLTTTWSYNSSDLTVFPLMIQFVPIYNMQETPTYVQKDLNITLGEWTIDINFPLAEAYDLRFIYANNDWETGRFQITMTEMSTNASDTSSSGSSDRHSTSGHSSTTLSTTESTGTGTSFLVQGTTRALGWEATATAATAQVSSSSDNYDRGLSTGAKVGIGIGCAVAVIMGIVGLSVLYRIKKKGNFQVPPEPQDSPDFGSKNPNESDSSQNILFEADGKHEATNMSELPSDTFTRSELPG
jgi:hypothetical protein